MTLLGSVGRWHGNAAHDERAFVTRKIAEQEARAHPAALVERVSGIDGAILIDKQGKCWALGVILDGDGAA